MDPDDELNLPKFHARDGHGLIIGILNISLKIQQRQGMNGCGEVGGTAFLGFLTQARGHIEK